MIFGPKTVEEFVALHPWKCMVLTDYLGAYKWRAMLVPNKDRNEWGNIPVAVGGSAAQAFSSLMTLQVNEKGELCESL
ncbi:hypothetical protein [Deinococcus cellulosilyticus]|uniref:Uncharacterized protein n=1 Tax=Deinococcus cellulosilyticus (strain DSM 18568 / NBRC 106333 / KACC 11606 / 5516J-15) TaxID=1223518 RepID=A0A511N7I6_DEIC1|nr:hypothetical protein [Deinococcus cellulosilyticus]GEM48805.1 hypothetical protein DC3_44400 [Deinococcus cellulosilyticus NBRC 106333 = KACC 11606]